MISILDKRNIRLHGHIGHHCILSHRTIYFTSHDVTHRINNPSTIQDTLSELYVRSIII